MKITRKSLKNLITEEVNKSRSLLLEMPYSYRAEDNKEERIDLTGQKLFHIARQADQLHELLKDDEILTDDIRGQVEDIASRLKDIFEAVMYDKQNPKGR
jgi:hypothetical protein